MSKYEIRITIGKVQFDLGNSTRISIREKDVLESISVDCGVPETYISLNGTYDNKVSVNIFEVLDYSLKDIASLLFDLIRMKKPNKLYLNSTAFDLAVKENLIPLLKEMNVALSESGNLIYDLNEKYYNLK